MKERNGKGNMSSLLVLLLFVVFAVCVLSVLLTGADAYQRLSSRDQESYNRRTAAQYITMKIRQSDERGMVFVGDFGQEGSGEEGDTLYLQEILDGEAYYTRLYCHDGYIRELFAQAGGGFAPEDGEKILPAQSLCFWAEDGMITVELAHLSGETERFVLALRSGEVAE